MKDYIHKAWLNNDDRTDSDYIICNDTAINPDLYPENRIRYIEINCNNQLTTLVQKNCSEEEFINKIITLKDAIDRFHDHLKLQYMRGKN